METTWARGVGPPSNSRNAGAASTQPLLVAGLTSSTRPTTHPDPRRLADPLPDVPQKIDHQREINEALRSLAATILDGAIE
jgi:hypothetical protein